MAKRKQWAVKLATMRHIVDAMDLLLKNQKDAAIAKLEEAIAAIRKMPLAEPPSKPSAQPLPKGGKK
jgi:hypothetical protein